MDHLKYCMSKMRGVNDEFTSWVLSSHWYKIQERNKWQTHCVWVGNKNLIFVPWYWAVSCSVFIPVMDPLLGRDALIMTNNEIHLILKLQPSPLKQVGSVTNPKCQYLPTWGWESFIFLQEATFVFSFLHFVEMMCNSTCVHMLSNSDIRIGSKAKRAHAAHSTVYHWWEFPGVFLSLWLQVWASCMSVTHSSKMTHLSSSQPHGLCFTTWLLSFTGGDEGRAFSGVGDEQQGMVRRRENSRDTCGYYSCLLNLHFQWCLFLQ